MGTKVNIVDTNKANLLKALEKTLGIVTSACKLCDLSRTVFYNYYNDDVTFKGSVDELQNVALDFAETALHNQIKDGIPSSTMFYLKTKGKGRGYIERLETINENKNTNVDLTPEERQQMIKDLKAKL